MWVLTKKPIFTEVLAYHFSKWVYISSLLQTYSTDQESELFLTSGGLSPNATFDQDSPLVASTIVSKGASAAPPAASNATFNATFTGGANGTLTGGSGGANGTFTGGNGGLLAADSPLARGGLNSTFTRNKSFDLIERSSRRRYSRGSSHDGMEAEDDRLSTTSDSSLSHQLNDVGDVQQIARIQEESKLLMIGFLLQE